MNPVRGARQVAGCGFFLLVSLLLWVLLVAAGLVITHA